MKRLSLVLLPAVFFSFMGEASAASRCEDYMQRWRSGAFPAVSQYTQDVLERAEKGLEQANIQSANSDFAQYVPGWALSVATTWVSLLDSQLRFTEQEQDLRQHTACLRLDLLLLECEMDQVRLALRNSIARGSIPAIVRLQELVEFLNERFRHLSAGALDPSYVDPTWGRRYSFDPPSDVWCCPQAQPGNTCIRIPEEQCSTEGGRSFYTLNQCASWGCVLPDSATPQDALAFCPYDADYAPPALSGFGCDAETMEPYSAIPQLKAEYDALKSVDDEILKFRTSAQTFLQIQQDIDKLFGQTPTLPEPPPARVHLRAYGCGWDGGYCSGDDHMTRCIDDGDCASAGMGTCDLPAGVCSENRAQDCFRDSDCPGMGTCLLDEPELPLKTELRGPFAIEKDQIKILGEFLGTRSLQELSREYRKDLKKPDEFTVSQPAEIAESADQDANPLKRYLRDTFRLTVRTWSQIQGREEAATFPLAADPQLEVAHSLEPLSKAISRLAKLSVEREGLRSFVLRYGYFLRRTCIYRPCNLVLERVLSIAFSDECFPYTNGEFLQDSSSNPRWKKCENALKNQ